MASATPNLERAYGVTNIRSHIPIILGVDDHNYDAWRELFLTHCQSFDVAGHLDGSLVPANDNDTTWRKRDGLVKLWLYGTLSKDLFRGTFKTGGTSREIWIRVENFFRNNMEARAIQLDHRLRTQEIGDLTIHAYCQELKSISDLLANVDAPVSERRLVTYMLNGLNAKFDNIINVIKHRQPFPTFDQARSMLILEEDRLNKGKQPHHETSSLPKILQSSAQTLQQRTAPPQHQQRSQSNIGRRGGNNRGRGRNFRPQYQQGNTPFWNPMWPNQPVNPWIQHQQTSLLGPRPQVSSTSTQAYNAGFSCEPTTDFASAFNTFTPAENQWNMDSGATAYRAHSADGGRDLPADPSDLRRYEAARWLRNTLGVVGGRDFPAHPSDLRRYEAARWLRNTLGVVGGRDLPADPSEEDFRIALRSGILLCNVLNRVKPGALPKAVEAPYEPLVIQDGASLSAFQYFENLRNFLVVVEEMGIPTFEVSDFEKGGKSARIVECVLALKSYHEWKQSGGTGSWLYIVNSKPTTFGMAKQYRRKDSETNVGEVTSSPSNTPSSEQSLFDQPDSITKHGVSQGTTNSIDAIVRAAFSDKSLKQIPGIVEDMLKSVMVEYERRLATQNELYGEEVTEVVNNNIEASQDDNVKEGESKDCKLYGSRSQELQRDLKSIKAGLSLLQMKYQQKFTSLALGETLSTLKFAERVAIVELGAARVNKDTSEVKELKEQIASLKLAVARKEREEEQTLLPNPLTPDQILRRKSVGVSSILSKSANTRKFQTKYKSSEIDETDSMEDESDSEFSLDLEELEGSPSWRRPKEEKMEYISGSEWIDVHEHKITRNSKPKEPEKPRERPPPPPRPCSKRFFDSSTKPKKDQPKTSRDDDNRSMIHSLIPMPSRRLLLGANNSPGQTSSRHNTLVVKRRQNPKE